MAASGHFLLLLAGLAAAARPLRPLETFTIPLPMEGTSFDTTVSACGTVPPFVIAGVPEAAFLPGRLKIFLPPQAPVIATTLTYRVGRHDATETIIATPLPGSCGPLSLQTSAATDTFFPTHTQSIVPPLSTGPSSPFPTGNNSSGPAPYANSTFSLCPIGTCAEGLISASAQRITSFLNKVTLATQRLESAALELGGDSSSSASSSRLGNTRRDSSSDQQGGRRLEPRFSILGTIVMPLEDIAATLTHNLPGLSPQPVFTWGCDSDVITAAASEFVEAQMGILQILLGEVDSLLGGGGSSRLSDHRDAEWVRRDDEAGVADLNTSHDDGDTDENFHVPFVGSLISGALKLIKSGVDDLVDDLIAILPARAECLRREGKALDDALLEVIAAFQ